MYQGPGNWVAIRHAVVYNARAAYAFSAGIKCRHCINQRCFTFILIPKDVFFGYRYTFWLTILKKVAKRWIESEIFFAGELVHVLYTIQRKAVSVFVIVLILQGSTV